MVEDLNVKALQRIRLARSLGGAAWGTFRRMLEYKASWYGARLVRAPRNWATLKQEVAGHLGLPTG